jgi:hypothetical protein
MELFFLLEFIGGYEHPVELKKEPGKKRRNIWQKVRLQKRILTCTACPERRRTTAFIRALSVASAAKFNIAPVRWQHPSHVAIVPTESKGKRKEMTGTQHVGTLKHKFLQYISIKNVLVLFRYQNNF